GRGFERVKVASIRYELAVLHPRLPLSAQQSSNKFRREVKKRPWRDVRIGDQPSRLPHRSFRKPSYMAQRFGRSTRCRSIRCLVPDASHVLEMLDHEVYEPQPGIQRLGRLIDPLFCGWSSRQLRETLRLTNSFALVASGKSGWPA